MKKLKLCTLGLGLFAFIIGMSSTHDSEAQIYVDKMFKKELLFCMIGTDTAAIGTKCVKGGGTCVYNDCPPGTTPLNEK